MSEVFEVADRKWRGVGAIPKSGYRCAGSTATTTPSSVFDVDAIDTLEPAECISGLILRGLKKPCDCPAFGEPARRRRPLGATMVSARARALRTICTASEGRRGRRSAPELGRPHRRGSHEGRDPSQGARERGRPATVLRGERATASSAAPGRWRSASRRAGACSRWATAARPATPRTSPWSSPIRSSRSEGALPAIALGADAVALDRHRQRHRFRADFEHALDLLGRPADIALRHLLVGHVGERSSRALACARKRGLLTIGFAGRDGGRMVGVCEHCFVVQSWSIHRIQETHTMLLHLLWDLVHVALGEDDVL